MGVVVVHGTPVGRCHSVKTRWETSKADQAATADPPPREALAGAKVSETHEVILSVECRAGPPEGRP